MDKAINEEIVELLPHAPPFIFVDRVLSIESGKIIASTNINGDEEYLKGHFPGNPVMPGVLIIESMAQASGIMLSHCGDGEKIDKKEKEVFYLSRVSNMRFKSLVLPGDTLIITAEILKQFGNSAKVHSKCEVSGKLVAEGELILSKKEEEGVT